MRPSPAPGVVDLRFGRRGRERAPGSGVFGACVGRAMVWVDCEAVVDDGVHWNGCCVVQNGWTALIWAARNCHVEAVALLLDRGADPEVRDNVGGSPLGFELAARGPEPSAPRRFILLPQRLSGHLAGDGNHVCFGCAATAAATLARALPPVAPRWPRCRAAGWQVRPRSVQVRQMQECASWR